MFKCERKCKYNYARDSDFCAHSLHVQPNVRLKGTPGPVTVTTVIR